MTELETYAIMVLCAADADAIWHLITAPETNPTVPAPGASNIAYLTSDFWTPIAQLRCDDLIIDKGLNCYYGLVLQCSQSFDPFIKGDWLVAIRGTMDDLEWVNDALAGVPIQSPRGSGQVGAGFWEIYASMTLNDFGGNKLSDIPAQAIVDHVNAKPGALYLTGHSLGAALATYLAADLQVALRGTQVAFHPYFFASPKPGTPDYANNYQLTVPVYSLTNYSADLVPALPPDWLFASLNAGGPTHDVHTLQRGAAGSLLPVSVGNNHSPVGYALMCDFNNPRARSLLPAGVTVVQPPPGS